MAATDHDLLRDPLKLQEQWHWLSLRTHDCPQTTPRMAVERTLCPAVAHDASGPFPRWSTCLDWPAGYAWFPQIGLQAGYMVVCGMRLLGFFGSAKLEQALCRPSHEGSERRSGSFGQGAHAAPPTSSGNLRIIKGCIYAVWGVGSARKPRAPTQEPRRGSCSFVWWRLLRWDDSSGGVSSDSRSLRQREIKNLQAGHQAERGGVRHVGTFNGKNGSLMGGKTKSGGTQKGKNDNNRFTHSLRKL